ncbi:MAG: hypothetical protein QOI58_4055 [Thermoanaerobaculia bacterium]|nr:hypothetical protein [Thermoanaerobaculia bacterium]
MSSTAASSFAFNASALAFGGRIQQPSCSVIPSQGSVFLAPSGGEGYETIRNFDYKGIITFDEASVYVAGSEHGNIRNTLASVTIKNLNVLNLFHAESLSSRVSSRHVMGEDEGEITFQGTSIENLRIGGRQVTVKLDHDFYSLYPTHAELTKMMAQPLENGDESKQSIALQARDGSIHGSLVGSIGGDIPVFNETPVEAPTALTDPKNPKDPKYQEYQDYLKYRKDMRCKHPIYRNGNVVTVAEFGSIKIGELIIKPGERRLNLLRFQFGCPFVGDGSGLCVATNGTDILPRG